MSFDLSLVLFLIVLYNGLTFVLVVEYALLISKRSSKFQSFLNPLFFSGQFTPPSDFRNLDPNIQNYIQQLAYAQYMQQHQQQQQQPDSNCYAQIVSNVNKDGNPYSANLPQLPSNLPEPEKNVSGQNSPVIVKHEVTEENGSESVDKTMVNKPLLSLATAYGK